MSSYYNLNPLVSLLKLVGEESRLKILSLLRTEGHCVCEIEENLKMSQSLVSHHLRDLKDAQLVDYKKDGQKVFYSLTSEGRRITNLLFAL